MTDIRMDAKGIAHEAFQHMESVGLTLAKRVLAEAPLRFQYGLSVVPVEQLAGRFGVTISTKDQLSNDSLAALSDLGLDGVARRAFAAKDSETGTNWFGSDYDVDILSRGFRSRFTLAHELAHVVLSKEYGHLEKSLSLNQRERVCDLAAGSILCPQEMLIEYFRSRTVSTLTVNEIEQLTVRMRISISLLLNRLRQLLFRNAVAIDSVALLVSLKRSRKRQENLAPRVASACSPGRWFVPLNTRLSSVGLKTLQDVFYKTPLYSSGHTKEVLTLWDYSVGRRAQIPCDVNFKCYRWASPGRSTNTTETRIMLAIANCEKPL